MSLNRQGDLVHAVSLRLRLGSILILLIATCLGAVAESAILAPSAGAVDLSGKEVDPLHLHPGRAVVLIFIRSDCPISNRYAPTIRQLSAQYGDKVTFWLVYPDKSESAVAIRRHLNDYGYELAALRDPRYSLVKLSQVQVTPEAAVFDGNGQLVYHGRIDNWYEGFGRSRSAPTTHELDDAIQAVLGSKKPSVTTAPAVGCYISDLQ
jgi:hypothetical protein